MTPANGHSASSWHGVRAPAEELLQVPWDPGPLPGLPPPLATAGPWGWSTALLKPS